MSDQGQSLSTALLSTPVHDVGHQGANILSDLQDMMATSRRRRTRTMSTQGSALSRSRSKGSSEGMSDIIDKDLRGTSESGNASSTDLRTAEENTSRCPTARLLSFSSDDSLDTHMPAVIIRTARENSAFSDTSAGSTGSTAISPKIGQHFSDLATAISQKSRGRSPTMRFNTNSQFLTPREAWSKVPPGAHSVIRPMGERPTFFSYPIEASATSGTSTPYTTTESTSLIDFSTAKSLRYSSSEDSRPRSTSCGIRNCSRIDAEVSDLKTAVAPEVKRKSSLSEFRTAILEETHHRCDDNIRTAVHSNFRTPETTNATIVLGAPGCRAVSVHHKSDLDHLVTAQQRTTGAVTEDGTTDENANIKLNVELSSGQNVSNTAAPIYDISGLTTSCPSFATSEATSNQMDLPSTLQNLQDTINYLSTAKTAPDDNSASTAKENPVDYGSPVSASGSRPPSVYERDHWDLARNANSDQNSTLREKKDHRGKTSELSEHEVEKVAALITHVKVEAEQQAKQSISRMDTAKEAPMSPTSGVATAHDWSASPTHGVRTAIEVSATPTKGVTTAMDLDQKDPKTATATSAQKFTPTTASLHEHFFRMMGPDILDSRMLAAPKMATSPLDELFTTRPPSQNASCASSVSLPTPIPSPCPSAEVKSNVAPTGLALSSRRSPARVANVSSNLYPERRQRIVAMKLRQSKSGYRSRSRSRSPGTTNSQVETASLGSSLHSHQSIASSEKPPSMSGQRLGGSSVGKACSRLLREHQERAPASTSQKRIETTENAKSRRMSMPSALRSTATESSIREANSTTVLSSAASSRLSLQSGRRQSMSSATTSGSRFGRRVLPGDGYPTNSTGTSSRSEFQPRRSLHLPAGRFGLPAAPKGWESRQHEDESLTVEPEIVGEAHRKSESSVQTARNSAVTISKATTMRKKSKEQDTSLKTALSLKSKKPRERKQQDTRSSYYGLQGRIKRISRKSKRKPTNVSTTSAHPEEAPTQEVSPNTFSSRRIRHQVSPRLKTAVNSFESNNTQVGVKPAKIVIHEQSADGSFKLELHVSCKMNSTGRVNVSGTMPEGLIPKRVTVNGKNLWAGV